MTLPPAAPPKQRVTYLFGAGASHACVKNVGSSYGILMRDLNQPMQARMRDVVEKQFKGDRSVEALFNNVVSEDVDFEHVITFLDESPSVVHRRLATELRNTFETVLRARLVEIEKELGRVPDDLYFALIDMYDVAGLTEELHGFLTLNYDGYLDAALSRSSHAGYDAGIQINGWTGKSVRAIKLHGSFDWTDTWPIAISIAGGALWIPPGIQKAKERYPFNLLWGRARELLDCDILRIVGCRLSANDWDLISLLFSTLHTHTAAGPYRIEFIDAPVRAAELKRTYPYLGIQSVFELNEIGPHLFAELTGGGPQEFAALSDDQQKTAEQAAGTTNNWFRLWLKHKAELALRSTGSVVTKSGAFKHFLETY